MTKQQIIKALSNHLLKLSGNDKLLAKERWALLIDTTHGNIRLLRRLANEPTQSYAELHALVNKLLPFYP